MTIDKQEKYDSLMDLLLLLSECGIESARKKCLEVEDDEGPYWTDCDGDCGMSQADCECEFTGGRI